MQVGQASRRHDVTEEITKPRVPDGHCRCLADLVIGNAVASLDPQVSNRLATQREPGNFLIPGCEWPVND